MKTVTIEACECLACSHVWIPRKPERARKCPRCQCFTWDDRREAERLAERRRALLDRISA